MAHLGIAVLGSVGVAVYRNDVSETLPAGVPPDAAEGAKDTLGGAVGAAEALPDALGMALLDVAREAFTLGFQVAAVTSAAVAVATAVLVAVQLRRTGNGAEQEVGATATAEPAGLASH